MLKLSKLKDKHAGRPAAILGGGPSMPAQIKKLPPKTILIAVNYHALYYCKPHFVVYNDAPSTNPLMERAVNEWKNKTIFVSPAPEPTSNVEFDVPNVWTGHYSSNTATWLALWMGCDPVILCGMDMYQGAVKHCPPSTYHSEMFDFPLDFYMRPWREECKNSVPHPERIRAMSGPLVELFGAWNA